MSGFTKGPWLMNTGFENPDLLTGGYRAITAGKGFFGGEESPQGFELSGYISEPDAHLIAAAPDLLEALEMIVSEADSYTARTGNPVYNWLDQARAAIARARGAE